MKTQKSLLLIPAILSLAWGLSGLLAPASMVKMLGIPATDVNPELLDTQAVLSVAQLGLAFLALWMRTITEKKALAGGMTVISLIFVLFGLQGILRNVMTKGLASNTIILVQSIVLLLLAVVFFVKRKTA